MKKLISFLGVFIFCWIILIIAFNLDSIFNVFNMPISFLEKVIFLGDIFVNNLKNLSDISVLMRLIFAVFFSLCWIKLRSKYQSRLIYAFYLVLFANLFVPLFFGLGYINVVVALTIISICALLYTFLRSAILKA